MAGDGRDASRHLALFQTLSAAPYSFDFYQALRRIECVFADHPRIGETRRPQDDPVRFGQDPSLAFATSTLAAFVPGEDGLPPRLSENFFGLFGPNGPLPLHLTDFARDRLRNVGDRTLVRFLDVFHHRLIGLFYRAWARAQPTVSRDRPDRDRFSIYLGALIGLAAPDLKGVFPRPGRDPATCGALDGVARGTVHDARTARVVVIGTLCGHRQPGMGSSIKVSGGHRPGFTSPI
jgi:type VI secretion system protein ImpH